MKNLHHKNQKMRRRLFGHNHRHGMYYFWRRWLKRQDLLEALHDETPIQSTPFVNPRMLAVLIAAALGIPLLVAVALALALA